VNGQQGGVFIANSPMPAWIQGSAEITEEHETDEGIFYCNLRNYNFGDGDWELQTKRWLLDSTVSTQTMGVGSIVTAYWSQQRGMFLPIVEATQPPIPFELKEDLTPGGGATAFIRTWDEDEDDWVADEDSEIVVYDRDGTHRGRGKNKFEAVGFTGGSVGTCLWITAANRYEIDDMVPHTLEIHGTTTASVNGGDFTIDNIEYMSPIGSIITTDDPSKPIPITNRFGHEGDSGAHVTAKWNEIKGYYQGVQMTCPLV
jgi:hypothetical protein